MPVQEGKKDKTRERREEPGSEKESEEKDQPEGKDQTEEDNPPIPLTHTMEQEEEREKKIGPKSLCEGSALEGFGVREGALPFKV